VACHPRVRCFAQMSAAHVSSPFLHRPLSGLRAAVFLQDPVSVPPSCTPARVGRPQAITSPEPIPPRSASHHRSRRRRDRAADVEPARAVNLWLSLRAVMFSPRRCVHSHTKPQRIPDPGNQMSLPEFRVQTGTFSRKTSWASAHESFLSPRVNQAGPRETREVFQTLGTLGRTGPAHWATNPLDPTSAH
jgi:hypothetical protein